SPPPPAPPSPTRRSSDLDRQAVAAQRGAPWIEHHLAQLQLDCLAAAFDEPGRQLDAEVEAHGQAGGDAAQARVLRRESAARRQRSEEHTSELQSREKLVC